MKKVSRSVVVMLAIVVAVSMSFAAQTKEEVKSLTTVFKKDRLIEVAFLSVKPDKNEQLTNEYFKKVFPIAQEYGLKPLANIKVEYAYSDFIQPQMVGFFEWESKEKHDAFLKDPRYLKLKPIRTDALSFLRMGYFTVEEDTEVTFVLGELIELFALWFNPKEAYRMQTYFKNVLPLITGKDSKYDVKFPLTLKPYNMGVDSYNPEQFGMAIWKSKESNNHFFGSSEYSAIKADKDAALRKLDVWQGQIILE